MTLLARLIYWLLGWQARDHSQRLAQHPPVKKFVMIVAPHTSNWDFFYALWARYLLGYGYNTKFLGKHSLFKPPFGWFFYWLGGTPVNRSKKANLVEQCAKKFADAPDELGIILSPEGTRKYIAQWRTGFYHIAVQAGVPIIPVALDYAHKRVEVLPVFYPSGNIEQDLPQLKALFKNIKAYKPENYNYEND